MEGTRAQTAEQRESAAHKLELSALKIEDGRIRGTLKGFEVTLEGGPPFHTCVIDFGSTLPIDQAVMRPGDLNHPDAVETMTGEFDEAMQVVASPGLAPTAKAILSDAAIQHALLTFLRKHQDSVLTGRTLTIRSSEPIVHQTVLDAVTIAKLLTARFAEIGFLETDQPITLPPHKYSEAQGRELISQIVGGAFGGTVSFTIIAVMMDLPMQFVGTLVAGGLALAAGAIWNIRRRTEKK
ncbi:MAG: hypothetical protein JNM17_07060 [Archangium sp.]|nr:hypothetical protein [Archangium sp.]